MIPVLLTLLACGTPATPGPDPCNERSGCGWGEVCQEGVCVDPGCATSAQCPINTFCEEGTCEEGCREPADCGPGLHCDVLLQDCVADRCQDTQVDCGFREYCDTSTGTCFDAGDQFCRPCERSSQCGEGNVCFQGACGVDCNADPCPSGFDCLSFRDNTGAITAYQCVTYCWLYE